MLDIFIERLRQKSRTVGFPDTLPSLPPRFRGRPFIHAGKCRGAAGEACGACAAVCPVAAISLEGYAPALDMGICTFCGLCARACEAEALVFTTDWRLATTVREALIVRPATLGEGEGSGGGTQSLPLPPPGSGGPSFVLPPLPVTPNTAIGGAFKRSFRLRQVTAAGCGACEADLNVLGTVVFDLARFGMDFVASPRHADGLLLTGPVPRNMREALLKCLRAMPEPKAVLAVGACAISGGLFRSLPGEPSPQQADGAAGHLPVNLYIPGCPPHPYTSLDGMLRYIGLRTP